VHGTSLNVLIQRILKFNVNFYVYEPVRCQRRSTAAPIFWWVCHGECVCGYDCCRTHDEEPLPLAIFIHADDVVRRRRLTAPASTQSV